MKNDRQTTLDILADAPWLTGLAAGLPELLLKEGRLEHYSRRTLAPGGWRTPAAASP